MMKTMTVGRQDTITLLNPGAELTDGVEEEVELFTDATSDDVGGLGETVHLGVVELEVTDGMGGVWVPVSTECAKPRKPVYSQAMKV
jgi:hypothetical protein